MELRLEFDELEDSLVKREDMCSLVNSRFEICMDKLFSELEKKKLKYVDIARKSGLGEHQVRNIVGCDRYVNISFKTFIALCMALDKTVIYVVK